MQSGKVSSHVFGVKLIYLCGYVLVKTYSGRDTSETGGDNPEYELAYHEFENQHLSKSSEDTISCLGSLVRSIYIT